MPVSTIYPQNYAATTITADGEDRNISQHPDMKCTPTKRCMCLFIPVIVVILIMICAIVIPLVVTSSRNKDAFQLTTISTTESATNRTEITNSSTSSNDTTGITSNETMASTVSSANKSTQMNSISSGWEMNATTTIISSNESTNASIEPNSTATTTTEKMIELNQENDTIIGLYNTTAGGSTGGSNGKYSDFNEIPRNAMDRSLTTKYLNFGHKGGVNKTVNGPGIGTGFLVIPSVSNSTLACGLHFATADDNPQRDPITVTLEGSNASSLEALHNGSSWILIYNGSTGINDTSSPNRTTYGEVQNFENKIRYTSYRLLITSQRGEGDAVQYSEARIMGYV